MALGEQARGTALNFAALSLGESLLVWSWRKIVAGRSDCPLIAREYSLLCGEDAVEVFATLYTFLQALAYAGRSRWQIGYPGYPSLTNDERRMLDLIATAQSDDTKRFERCLRVLAHATLRHALGIAARALGTALDEHHLRLPLSAPVLVSAIAVQDVGLSPPH